MYLHYSKLFKKKYKALSPQIKSKVEEKLAIFVADQFDEVLNNHKLNGEYKGYRSINITGDIRIVYRVEDDTICYLHTIGTHSDLYS